MVQFNQHAQLDRVGPSPGGQAERERNLLRGRFAALAEHSLGQMPGRFDELDVVHQGQRLQRRVGPLAAGGAILAAGGVENLHRRRRGGPFPERVHAPPIQRVALVLLEIGRVARRVTDRLPNAGRLIRLHARAALLLDQQAAQRQGAVADHLRVEPEPRPSRYQAIVPVPPIRLRRGDRGLSIGRTGDDQLLHVLDVPAAFDELGGQPIQEGQVRGPFALRAEILGRLDDARAEVLLPIAVDRHTGRQRIVRIDQPLGQAQPVVGRALGQRGHFGRNAPLDFLGRLIVLASGEQLRRFPAAVGLGQIAHDERGDRRLGVDRRDLLAKLRDLRLQRRDRIAGFRINLSQEVIAQLLFLLGRAFRWAEGNRRPQVLRERRLFVAFLEFLPGCQRIEPPSLMNHAGLVPIDRAVELGEGPAVEHRADFETDLGRFDLQQHPLAGLGQLAHGDPAGGVRLAPGDQVFAPVGAVFPSAVVELQHDLLRRILGIEIDVGEQPIALFDL